MKLRIVCVQCIRENRLPSTHLEYQSVEIQDDGLYSSTCSNGHTVLTVLQEHKFEILFDFGAMALIDGYPREAVTSMSAALERFYEFYITVTCLKHDIDIASFQKAWKHVASQSERQFGAYLFVYLIDHQGDEPPVIDNERPKLDGLSKSKTKTWKEFRNAVVHKGYIPSYSETVAYGNIVYHHLNELIQDLKERCGESILSATCHHIARAKETANGSVISTMSIPTLVSLTSGEATPETFEEALIILEKYTKGVNYE